MKAGAKRKVQPWMIAIAGALVLASFSFNIYAGVMLANNGSKANSKSVEIDPLESSIVFEDGAVVDEDDYDEYDDMDGDDEFEDAGDTHITSADEKKVKEIIEARRKKEGISDWTVADVYVDAKSKDGSKMLVYYTVRYTGEDEDEEQFVTLMTKKGDSWQFALPGYDSSDEILYEMLKLKPVDVDE